MLETVLGRGERRDIPQPVEDLLIDTALEGLRNAVKYTQAQIAIVHLAYEQDAIILVLQAGTQVVRPMDSGATQLAGTGAGLWMMRQRVAQLRGTLELTRDQDGQTVLRVELPTRLSRQSTP